MLWSSQWLQANTYVAAVAKTTKEENNLIDAADDGSDDDAPFIHSTQNLNFLFLFLLIN